MPLPVISSSASRSKRVALHHRHGIAGAHDVADVHQQPPPQASGRVRAREVVARETAGIQQRHGKRVAHGERRGGAGGGREIVRAGLLFHAAIEHGVGLARKARVAVAGEGDELGAHALDDRQDQQDFVGLAGVRQRQYHVGGRDHAEVAVRGLARMHEERRRAGGGERGGDLVADVTGFAHAGDDHAPGAGEDDLAGARELRVHALGERGQRVRLDLDDVTAELLEWGTGGHGFALYQAWGNLAGSV